MEMLGNVAVLIEKFGFTIVSAAVVIIAVIYLGKRQSDNYQKLLNTLLEKQIEKPHNSAVDHRYDDFYECAGETLDYLRTTTGAARAYIFMYHNGGKNLVGIPFQKMSCIYEVDGEGFVSLCPSSQNMQRSFYAKAISTLKEKGYYNVDDVESMEIQDNLYTAMKNRSVQSFYFQAIKDSSNNTVIGYVGIEFMFILKRVDERDKVLELLAKSTERISGIMEVVSCDKDCWGKPE